MTDAPQFRYRTDENGRRIRIFPDGWEEYEDAPVIYVEPLVDPFQEEDE